MKEATGELNMTVITVVALAAVGALLYTFIWPMIKQRIVQQTCNMMGSGYTAAKATDGSCTKDDDGNTCYEAEADNAGGSSWCCCQSSK